MRAKILEELTLLFREELENESIKLTEITTSNDIDEWDSINHIYLVVEIEQFYKIKFKSSKILEWINLGDMISSITELLK